MTWLTWLVAVALAVVATIKAARRIRLVQEQADCFKRRAHRPTTLVELGELAVEKPPHDPAIL